MAMVTVYHANRTEQHYPKFQWFRRACQFGCLAFHGGHSWTPDQDFQWPSEYDSLESFRSKVVDVAVQYLRAEASLKGVASRKGDGIRGDLFFVDTESRRGFAIGGFWLYEVRHDQVSRLVDPSVIKEEGNANALESLEKYPSLVFGCDTHLGTQGLTVPEGNTVDFEFENESILVCTSSPLHFSPIWKTSIDKFRSEGHIDFQGIFQSFLGTVLAGTFNVNHGLDSLVVVCE